MGNSDEGDRLPAPSSSDELSSILRQVLSRTPTAQPSFSPKKIVSSAEMFNRTFPLLIPTPGGAVSYAACAAAETGEGKCGFENKRNGAKQRNSLKRNIDAQFHNLSEKRRRSKINEKMKALQKLIPNSNKTDKASMLDEAIEYLKQLQLQFQTLAAMNGLGLNPLRLPPILPPTQTRITGTSEQGLNLETLLGGSHSMANHEPPEPTQEMCFSTTTLL
ncbi:unnamed protein product [Brassica napus]|uniref:(rape) hypothetical protein n=1 Tax=Brassica napus TaxID=3708 RepID=A0A679KK30_BRANA|nr:Unknown [Brassica napus]CAA8392189.1 Unknown [Brassica napus]CAA8403845.1 Unknown [Brassica napus]CAF2163493.1 unnamed protein product [Brassica napus]